MKKYKMGLFFAVLFFMIYICIIFVFQNKIVASSERKIDGIEEKGQTFEELNIPEDVRVVGIGEASHGNCEFQTAKLQMLRKLVETGRCHSIAFEMSPGEAAEINDAIHSEDVDITELMGRTDYPLYDTQQMIELVTWMRDYNRGKSVEESLMFYGVDMQGDVRDISYLISFGEKHTDIFSEEETAILNSLLEADGEQAKEQRGFIENLVAKLSAKEEHEYKYAGIVANTVIQSIDAPSFSEEPNEYSNHRDNSMAKNLKSFSDLEEERGYSQIIITAHNGHTMKGFQDGYGEASAMGQRINEIFDGSYFSVGTAYYNACVNIHVSGTYDDEYLRDDFNFCSEDILAYQAKYFNGGVYCLNFHELTEEDGEVYKRVHEKGFMGLVGEGYSAISDIEKLDRVKMVQSDRFDAVMYYYDVTPIRVLNY